MRLLGMVTHILHGDSGKLRGRNIAWGATLDGSHDRRLNRVGKASHVSATKIVSREFVLRYHVFRFAHKGSGTRCQEYIATVPNIHKRRSGGLLRDNSKRKHQEPQQNKMISHSRAMLLAFTRLVPVPY